MNANVPTGVVAAVLFLAGTGLTAKRKPDLSTQPVVPIRVYNPARVPGGVLRCATQETSRIFRAAGIKTVWEFQENDAFTDPGMNMSIPSPRTIAPERSPVIRIVRRPPSTWAPEVLGFALPFAPSGAHVSVFYDRIEWLALSVNAPSEVILGCAMAHELGHVLLRSGEHSAAMSGVMGAHWRPERWRLATAGLLWFTPEEAAAMRGTIAAFVPHQQETSLVRQMGMPGTLAPQVARRHR